MELNNENYFSQEMNMKYTGSSQIKDILKCPARAMAKLKGEYVEEKSTALLVGSYVDSYYEDTLVEFEQNNPDIINKRTGELKADYKKAEEIIERLEQDEMFSKYMSGEKQVIMTGELEGVPVKIKIDSYHKDKAIADLKVIRSFEKIYNPETNQKENFVYYWKYHWQAALYQEIVRQNTGKKLPFFLCAATKETVTDFNILSIPQDVLDEALNEIKEKIKYIDDVKKGKIEYNGCGKCDYCKSIKKITKIIDFRDI